MVYSEKSKRYNGRKARIAIALLAAVCLSSSGCIAALYNYDVEIESAEAVSEITAQTPKEAASTDGSDTPDAVYQAKLDSLPRDDRAGRKEVFNEWVKAKYPGPYEIYTPTEDEKWLFYDLKYWTAYDFCDVNSLTDEEMASSAVGYYGYADCSDQNFQEYGFRYDELDGYYSKVGFETVKRLVESLYGRGYASSDYPHWGSQETEQNQYVCEAGADAPEEDIFVESVYEVDEGVYYVIFGQEKLPDGTESDVTGMVIQRNSESTFGYNVIAARGYC